MQWVLDECNVQKKIVIQNRFLIANSVLFRDIQFVGGEGSSLIELI